MNDDELDGGALGMKLGEHKDPPDVFPGRKFYTIGKARTKPFKLAEHVQRNFLTAAPLPYWTVRQLLQTEGVDADTITNVKNAWTGYVEASVIASSGMTPGYYDRGSLPGTFCWDIKLMHQEAIREKDQDINGNLSRSEAIERLRAIRAVLTLYVPEELLRKLFRGWVQADMANGNPFLDPFTDMTLADFNSDMETVNVELNENSVTFTFNEMEGGASVVSEAPLTAGKYMPVGSKSKFFDAPTALVASKASIVYETPDAFLFAKEDNDKLFITAYGGKSSVLRSLVRSLLRDTHHAVFYVLVPSAMPATAHGRQECPPGAYPDLDLAKLWVKHFHGTATIELPERLDEGHLRLLRKQKEHKYSLVYAAMRNLKEHMPHTLCEDTGVPHDFWIRCEA